MPPRVKLVWLEDFELWFWNPISTRLNFAYIENSRDQLYNVYYENARCKLFRNYQILRKRKSCTSLIMEKLKDIFPIVEVVSGNGCLLLYINVYCWNTNCLTINSLQNLLWGLLIMSVMQISYLMSILCVLTTRDLQYFSKEKRIVKNVDQTTQIRKR